VYRVLTDVSFARANQRRGRRVVPADGDTRRDAAQSRPSGPRVLKGFVASAYSAATVQRRVHSMHRTLNGAVAALIGSGVADRPT
jgi:hypothetical protein